MFFKFSGSVVSNFSTKKGAQDNSEWAFNIWQKIIKRNKRGQKAQASPIAPIIEFYFGESDMSDLD